MECFSCKSISGEKRISPGRTIYEGNYWLVEHAYPSKLKGWLVIVLKRHLESLHKLQTEEFIELGQLLNRVSKILRLVFNCEKEYVMCFAEKEGFKHVHFHVVPVSSKLPQESRGSNVFNMLRVSEAEAIPREEIKEFCEYLKDVLK